MRFVFLFRWCRRHSVEFGIADDLLAAALDGVTAHVTLHLKLKNYTPPDEFEVAFNGKLLPRETRTERPFSS